MVTGLLLTFFSTFRHRMYIYSQIWLCAGYTNVCKNIVLNCCSIPLQTPFLPQPYLSALFWPSQKCLVPHFMQLPAQEKRVQALSIFSDFSCRGVKRDTYLSNGPMECHITVTSVSLMLRDRENSQSEMIQGKNIPRLMFMVFSPRAHITHAKH